MAQPNLNLNLNSTSIQQLSCEPFESLSPNSKSILISSSLSNLIISIATALKTRNRVNLLLQSQAQSQSNNAVNRQPGNQIIVDSLQSASHQNLLKLKADCETYLNRLTGFRDWLVSMKRRFRMFQGADGDEKVVNIKQ